MRQLSTTFRNSIESRFNDELILVFATIIHPSLFQPIRVVTEDVNGISFAANGLPINYVLNSKLYYSIPFQFQFLTDDDNKPSSKLVIQNVDSRIGEAILAIQTSPRFHFEIYASSDWDDVLDANNARNPIGTPVREYNADFLWLRNITGDELTISADITSFDISSEPCPAIRTTQDRTPALFR